jgi:hypothetical protein
MAEDLGQALGRAREDFADPDARRARIAAVDVPHRGRVGGEQRLLGGPGRMVEGIPHGPWQEQRERGEREDERAFAEEARERRPLPGREPARDDLRRHEQHRRRAHVGREPDRQAEQRVSPRRGLAPRPAREEQAAEDEREPRDVGHHLVREVLEPRVRPQGEAEGERARIAEARPREREEEPHRRDPERAHEQVQRVEVEPAGGEERRQEQREPRRTDRERLSEDRVALPLEQRLRRQEVDRPVRRQPRRLVPGVHEPGRARGAQEEEQEQRRRRATIPPGSRGGLHGGTVHPRAARLSSGCYAGADVDPRGVPRALPRASPGSKPLARAARRARHRARPRLARVEAGARRRLAGPRGGPPRGADGALLLRAREVGRRGDRQGARRRPAVDRGRRVQVDVLRVRAPAPRGGAARGRRPLADDAGAGGRGAGAEELRPARRDPARRSMGLPRRRRRHEQHAVRAARPARRRGARLRGAREAARAQRLGALPTAVGVGRVRLPRGRRAARRDDGGDAGGTPGDRGARPGQPHGRADPREEEGARARRAGVDGGALRRRAAAVRPSAPGRRRGSTPTCGRSSAGAGSRGRRASARETGTARARSACSRSRGRTATSATASTTPASRCSSCGARR